MQLRVARLCLDCDEVHAEQTCPICGSESFGYISRWVPAPERRTRPREVVTSPTADAYRELLKPDRPASGKSRLLQHGVIGVTAVSVLGWLWGRWAANAKREPKIERQSKIQKS